MTDQGLPSIFPRCVCLFPSLNVMTALCKLASYVMREVPWNEAMNAIGSGFYSASAHPRHLCLHISQMHIAHRVHKLHVCMRKCLKKPS